MVAQGAKPRSPFRSGRSMARTSPVSPPESPSLLFTRRQLILSVAIHLSCSSIPGNACWRLGMLYACSLESAIEVKSLFWPPCRFSFQSAILLRFRSRQLCTFCTTWMDFAIYLLRNQLPFLERFDNVSRLVIFACFVCHRTIRIMSAVYFQRSQLSSGVLDLVPKRNCVYPQFKKEGKYCGECCFHFR